MTSAHTILVTFRQTGFHCWPKAPEELAYLRNDHRHEFHFLVEVPVEHADRDIEVHQLKAFCQEWAARTFGPRRTASCEQLALLLCRAIHTGYEEPTWIKVQCWEDGECGGTCLLNFDPVDN